MTITLVPINPDDAEALAAGRRPSGVQVADDYPTEFSAGIGQAAGRAPGGLGPFFLRRSGDDVVVGEIGGALTGPGTLEIGYAVVASCWGRGYATAAVDALIAQARRAEHIAWVVAHTPLDRPASARVLEHNGFAPAGEHQDEHEGVPIPVLRWRLDVRGDAP
jgi:RimJ/RimL family protein N-acetyltransferase